MAKRGEIYKPEVGPPGGRSVRNYTEPTGTPGVLWNPKGGDLWLPTQYDEAPDGLSEANLAEAQEDFDRSITDMTEFYDELGVKELSITDPETGLITIKGDAADLLRDFVNRKAAEYRASRELV